MSIYVKMFCCLAILMFIHCATILHGTSQGISVNSDPTRADVVITRIGGSIAYAGATPMSCRLSRKEDYNVQITLEGYKQQVMPIHKEFSALFLCNLIIGGLLGMIIDAVDGAMYDLSPTTIWVSLARADSDKGQTLLCSVIRIKDRNGERTVINPLDKN